MAGRSGSIGAIKVDLGIDAEKLNKDLKAVGQNLSKEIMVTVKFNAPDGGKVQTWLDGLQKSVSSKKGIKVPLEFDVGIAKTNFDAAMKQAIHAITVPVHFRADGDIPGGGGPGGGRPSSRPSGGPSGGTSGGGKGPQANPSQPSASGNVKTQQQAQQEHQQQKQQSYDTAGSGGTASGGSYDSTGGAKSGQPAAPVPPKWGPGGHYDPATGKMIQDRLGRTIKTRRDPQKVEQERELAHLLNTAVQLGKTDVVDTVVPGLSGAMGNRSPGQMLTAYKKMLQQQGVRGTRLGRRMKGFGEASRSDVSDAALQYPLDFTVSALASGLNADTRPTAKRAGGVAAIAGGATPGRKTFSTPFDAAAAAAREAEVANRYPHLAVKEASRIRGLGRAATDAEYESLGEHDAALASWQKAQERAAMTAGVSASRGETPAPGHLQGEEALKRTLEKQAAQKSLDERLAGLPLDYGEDIYAGPMSFGALDRPFDIGTKASIDESIHDRLRRGRAMGGSLQQRLLAARIQKAYDSGNTDEGQRLQRMLETMRGGWGQAPGSRSSSLSDLSRVAADAESFTEVGEQGREGIVQMSGGESFVVPNHQLNQFKKMTGMAAGGAGPKGLRILGGGSGSYETRRFRAGEAAFAEGRAANIGTMSNDVQRVFVVNMPGGGVTGSQEQRERKKEADRNVIKANPSQPGVAAQALGIDPDDAVAGVTGSPGVGGRAGGTVRRQSTEGSLIKFAAQEAVGDLTGRLDQVGVDISEALQKSPVRALSVAIGQIAQTVVGGRAGILQRSDVARSSARRAGVAVRELESAEGGVRTAELELDIFRNQTIKGRDVSSLTKTEGDRYAALTASFEEALKRERAVRPEAEQRVGEAEAAAKRILTPAQQIKSQAVGVGGIVVGTLAFTAAMSAAQTGLQYVGQVAADVGDRLAGFGFTARRVAEDMSESVRQGGFAGREGVFAGQRAAAGLPDVDLRALQDFTTRLAAAQNLQRQTDLLRGERNLGGGQGPVQGIGVGFGNGLFGSFVGQTPGAVEVLSGQLENVSAERQNVLRGQAESQARREINAKSGATGLVQDAQNLEDAIFGRPGRNDFGGRANEIFSSNLQGAMASVAAANQQSIDVFNKSVDKFADFTNDVGPRGRLVQTTDQTLLEDTFRALTSPQVGASGDVAGRFRQSGVAIVGPTGSALPPAAVNKLFQQYLDSALVPMLGDLLKGIKLPTEASFRAQASQFELQRQLIPASAAEQLIARPFPERALTGVTARSGVDATTARAAGRYEDSIVGARDALMDIRDQGLTELRALGVPEQAIKDVQTLGTEITGLQAKAEDLQLGVEQAQYNEQIRLSVRGIGDLLALTGKQGMAIGDSVASATEYGRLQRAQIMDGRELARIQLARGQRELNLQIALSRLRSPGETPEERAVRRREAELLAKEQQRELDINKRSTGRGFRIQDIEFGRQLGDAVKQLGLLQQSRAVNVEVRGIQRIVEAKEQLLQVKQAYLTVAREAGVAVREGSIRIVEQMETILGKMTDAQISTIRRYVRQAAANFRSIVDLPSLSEENSARIYASGKGAEVQAGMRKRQAEKEAARPRAMGGIDLISSPTRFLAGEAGSEAVVVLRNPRMNAAPLGFRGAGSGGGSMVVNLTLNAAVHGDGDENRLVRKVVRALHDEAAIFVGG